jgi:hypothetical protein
MDERPIRFGLRELFLAITTIACSLGAYTALYHFTAAANRETIRREAARQAYWERRITRDEARAIVGNQVDDWPAPPPK